MVTWALTARTGRVIVAVGVVVGLIGCENEPIEEVVDLQRRFLTASVVPTQAPRVALVTGELHLVVEPRAGGHVLALPVGQLVVPIDAFVGDAVLELAARVAPAAGVTNASLTLTRLDERGSPGADSATAQLGESWAGLALPLTGRGDAVEFISVTTSHDGPPGPEGVVEIRSPRLRILDAAPRRLPETDAGPESTARPDVFIVVLDAARASNFGAYGYHRDTTPEIDAVAERSLVFTHAFSECPNTSCSIPNLISGVSFANVGDPPQWDRLSDNLISLAEYLADAGYYTIGLSGNPNNSNARNSTQGFHEFHEMWKRSGGRGRDPRYRNPHRLSQRAIEALTAVDPDQPVFTLLHYVPPHEPYEPTPDFDLFGDPAYDGPVRPGVLLRDVRRGEWILEPADVAEMIALYDGNLRMGDDAVGDVFDAIRGLGRWDDALVLVTSDHGEAMMEHGVQGHNATLYDEMLHIPFILRLPDDRQPDIDTSQLVILTDVVPTILGLLGLEPGPDVDGLDLLAPPPPSDRVIFQRRPGNRRFGTRTLRWKALFSRRGRPPMLFDLHADPEEHHNLAETYPAVHHGFAALLRDHLLETRARNFQSDEGLELPEEDLRQLRALGYLR